MLKRNDLVKQFELVVKQEIKNHNDSKLATNLAINSLKDGVKELSTKINSCHSSLESDLNMLNCEQNGFQKVLCSLKEYNDSRYRDLLAKQEETLSELKKNSEEFNSMKEKHKALNCEVINLMTCVAQCKSENKFLEYQLDTELDRVKHTFSNELKIAIDQMGNLPSEAEAVKAFILERLDVQNVDFLGLMKELKMYKKNVYIIEKNIENIYTLLDRLKTKTS